MTDRTAILLSIGDELALGQTVDTNTGWLAQQLAERGITCPLHLTIADDRAAIADAFRHAADRADLVIATGGLGPTEDDLTRVALADVLKVDLVLDEAELAAIADFFARRGRTMIDRNRVQAMCPQGARMLRNQHGTAPGMHLTLDGAEVYCLPGVPREMKGMFADHLAPALPEQSGRVILARKVNTFGLGESDLAERLGDTFMHRDRNPTVGTTVADGIVSVRIRSAFPTRDAAQRELTATIAEVRDMLGPLVFGEADESLAAVVGAMLTERGQTVAVAESCTGGLIGRMLSDPAGASAYFAGGWITYSDALKTAQLGVPADTLSEHGAVSDPVARAMAEGARRHSDADHAIAVTGIAGPTGGSDAKPVGTVYLALASRDAATDVHRHAFPGDREHIRHRTAMTALNHLRLRLLGQERAK